jgi:hypothetical protein
MSSKRSEQSVDESGSEVEAKGDDVICFLSRCFSFSFFFFFCFVSTIYISRRFECQGQEPNLGMVFSFLPFFVIILLGVCCCFIKKPFSFRFSLTPFLESSQLPSAVRAAVETSKEKETIAALVAFRDERTKEIRSTCDNHYQSFVRSVDELLDVRADTMTLRDEIVEINQQLQTGGAELVKKTEELVKYKRQLRNIKLLSTVLGSCKQFWQLVDRANRDTRDGKYFEALRSIVDLERALRPPSRLRELEFGRYVLATLPLMRERVREGSLHALNQWLEIVRRRAIDIGKLAVDRTARRAEHERKRLRIRPSKAAATATAIDDDDNSNNNNNNNYSSSNNDDDHKKHNKKSSKHCKQAEWLLFVELIVRCE